MKRKSPKKLALQRETLSTLEGARLAEAQFAPGITSPTPCYRTTCMQDCTVDTYTLGGTCAV